MKNGIGRLLETSFWREQRWNCVSQIYILRELQQRLDLWLFLIAESRTRSIPFYFYFLPQYFNMIFQGRAPKAALRPLYKFYIISYKSLEEIISDINSYMCNNPEVLETLKSSILHFGKTEK